MSETIVKVENESGGSVGDWTLLGTLTKTHGMNGSSPYSDSYLQIPDSVKEIFVDIDMTGTFSTITVHCVIYSAYIPDKTVRSINIANTAKKSAGASIMLNLGVDAVYSKRTVSIWDVYDYDGNAAGGNHYACNAKVYYR